MKIFEFGSSCDIHTVAGMENQVYVIALSEAANGAVKGGEGASIVVKNIAQYAYEHFDEMMGIMDGYTLKNQIIDQIVTPIEKRAKEARSHIDEYAATMLFIAIKGNAFLMGHIGDGMIAYGKEDRFFVASKPDIKCMGSQVYYVTTKFVNNTMRLIRGSLAGIDGFAVLSRKCKARMYDEKSCVISAKCYQLFELFLEEEEEQLREVEWCEGSIVMIAKEPPQVIGEEYMEDGDSIIDESGKVSEKYKNIVIYWKEGLSIVEIARREHIKVKYLKRKIKRMTELGILQERELE